MAYRFYGSENASVTDRTGRTLPLYRAAPFPDGAQAGDLADLLCIVEFRGDFLQLRNGTSDDYLPHGRAEQPRLELLSKMVRKDRQIRVSAQCGDGIAFVQIKLLGGEETVFSGYLYPKEGVFVTELPKTLKPGSYEVEIQAASARRPQYPVTGRARLTVEE